MAPGSYYNRHDTSRDSRRVASMLPSEPKFHAISSRTLAEGRIDATQAKRAHSLWPLLLQPCNRILPSVSAAHCILPDPLDWTGCISTGLRHSRGRAHHYCEARGAPWHGPLPGAGRLHRPLTTGHSKAHSVPALDVRQQPTRPPSHHASWPSIACSDVFDPLSFRTTSGAALPPVSLEASSPMSPTTVL